jgi:coatomer subunit beta'
MSICFNPKDPNTFASACLDKTVKIWSLGSKVPNFTLTAPESKGFNYVDYYPHSDKPYLLTSSDDKSIKIWDYQTKSCVASLEGHVSNVSFAVFHAELPLIISGSEDSTIKIWNSNTYKLEKTLNYRLERAWCISTRKNTSLVAVGFDAGNVVFQLGDDKPLLSMDQSGKIIWCKHNEVYHSIIKASDATNEDGEVLSLTQKEFGSVEVFPNSLVHSPNGRFVSVTGDDEYIIYTSLAWRNKMYGKALDFVWAQDSNYYAIRESKSSIKIFKNFKEKPNGQINLIDEADKIFGGALLAVKSGESLIFYDWESGEIVRSISVDAENVFWSDEGDLVLISSNESAYALTYDREIFQQSLDNGTIDPEEGVIESFDVAFDVEDQIVTGKWVGNVFIYTSASNRLNYLVGGSIYNLAHFDKTMFLLGYLSRDNKVYVSDKDMNVISYYLSLAVLEYQTVVMRGDLEYADSIINNIDERDINKIARFLEEQGYTEKALELSNDLDQKFDLAIQTLNFDLALDIATKEDSIHKWKKLGDTSLSNWKFDLAIKSFENSKDYESLLLLYTSLNNTEGLKKLSSSCIEIGKYNSAFAASWAAKDLNTCFEILKKSNRFTEAAFLSLVYNGDINQLDELTKLWKENLTKNSKDKISSRILSPVENPSAFPSLKELSENLIDISDEPEVEKGIDEVTEDVTEEVTEAPVEEEDETAEDFEEAEEEVNAAEEDADDDS